MLFLQMMKWRRHVRFMRLVQLSVLTLFSLLFSLRAASAQTSVFINEIHYDNNGADVNEAIEIAGPAGADLTGWSIVLYSGSNGAVYDTDTLSGTIPNLCNGFGVMALNYPANGIQNGAPDGIALVNPSNTVIQFLSYEGSFTAVSGPADGMVSTDVGVAEAGTEPPGQSLQLSGTGQFYENFAWNAPAASTFGACNAGQNFVGGDTAPSVAATTPTNSATQVAVNANITITFSESVNAAGSWFSISGGASGSHTATVSGGPTTFTLDPDVDFATNETVTVNIFAFNVTDQDADDPPDNMAADYTFSFTTPSLIINEILADPGSTNGDANGDGTIDTGQDEFIELVNVSGAALDISGWTLSDAVQVRHTFPAGTTVTNQCGIIVFGGGTPTGSFGNVVVQVASTGQLGLNNAGDTVTLKDGATVIATYTYGPEGGNDQSLTRGPDITGPTPLVQHASATGAGGRLHSPGIRVNGSQFPGCQPLNITKEIFEIQGSGLASPFANQNVTTENNVVTAVGSNGFFMQTPAARSDNEEQTSDGIFVFIPPGGTPVVNVGDLVNVTGEVVEFFNFTEFSNNPTVTTVSSGNPLPPAIQFDDMTPVPNQPQSVVEYERFECMLVQIVNGVVAASNQTFGSDPIAEALIVAGPNRPFREPGVEYPGLPGLPVWDRNPEIFEFDPDRLGQPNMAIPAGSAFSATGVVGFEFGGYELWPASYSVNTAALPRAVRGRNTGESTIATLNLHLFYDAVDDPGIDEPVRTPQQYANKLNKLSMYIRTLLGAPDILAVQEAEKLQALQDLANKINSDDALLTYTPYLIEGNDISGIDVGFLVRRGVTVNAVMQLGATEVFTPDNTLLHDRPPLLLNAKLADSSAVSVLAVHLRSLNGIDDPNDGPRVRQKRHAQAVSVSHMVQNLQTGNSNIKLAVAGDFNAFQFTDGYVHVLGQIMGTPASASEALISGTDNVNPDLANAVLSLPANEQYSFVFEGSAQVLDHVLVSQALRSSVTGIQYARANSDAAESFETDGTTVLRASDHDGLVLFVKNSPPTEVASSNQLSVTSYGLAQNYPNPFSTEGISHALGNPSTMINFALLAAGKVTVKIFAETGQLVQTLVDGEMSAGRHQLRWNGRNQSGSVVAAGVYLYRITVQGRNGELVFSETKRMTLLK
ncbi:lamin tail domain-containing protein [candidate division KSB1 bacterium]|nr:lamin tail domain-containing protein [candidate division KSB1 bacterium]